MAKKNEELNPSEYFNNLKDKIQNITDEELVEFYQGCLSLVEKYKITGQKRVIQKLRFLVDCVEKEREAVKLGINSFVYREDIEEYIDNISKEKYEKQYNNLEIINTNIFHDRFIIIDNKELYHSGASFKDLGKKCFAITKIEDNSILKELLNKLKKIL